LCCWRQSCLGFVLVQPSYYLLVYSTCNTKVALQFAFQNSINLHLQVS
jgi:hypothetical protein